MLTLLEVLVDDGCETSVKRNEVVRIPWYVEQYLSHFFPACFELRNRILLDELHSFLINLVFRLTFLEFLIHVIKVTLRASDLTHTLLLFLLNKPTQVWHNSVEVEAKFIIEGVEFIILIHFMLLLDEHLGLE
jgi:hypothetical protein